MKKKTPTLEEQISDLDDQMLALTWERVGLSGKQFARWEEIMKEIAILQSKQKSLQKLKT